MGSVNSARIPGEEGRGEVGCRGGGYGTRRWVNRQRPGGGGGSVVESEDKWCCMYKVMSCRMIQLVKASAAAWSGSKGHVCLFLPKFHCELTRSRSFGVMQNIVSLFSHSSCLFIHSTKSTGYRNVSDGKFSTAKGLVLQCLDMCDVITMRCFFRKVWWYMDVYQCASLHIIWASTKTDIFSAERGSMRNRPHLPWKNTNLTAMLVCQAKS